MGILGTFIRLFQSSRSCNPTYEPAKGDAVYNEIGNPKFTKYVIESLKKRYIAFDVETTGLKADKGDRIVEISAVLFVEGKPVKSFTSLVNPRRFIPFEASRINGISNLVIWLAPSEDTAFRNLLEFFNEAINGDTIICAHNASFDCSFFCEAMTRLGYKADLRVIDTLYLARKYVKNLDNYKLCTLAEHYDIAYSAHNALADAKACGLILWEILNDLEKAKLKKK